MRSHLGVEQSSTTNMNNSDTKIKQHKQCLVAPWGRALLCPFYRREPKTQRSQSEWSTERSVGAEPQLCDAADRRQSSCQQFQCSMSRCDESNLGTPLSLPSLHSYKVSCLAWLMALEDSPCHALEISSGVS